MNIWYESSATITTTTTNTITTHRYPLANLVRHHNNKYTWKNISATSSFCLFKVLQINNLLKIVVYAPVIIMNMFKKHPRTTIPRYYLLLLLMPSAWNLLHWFTTQTTIWIPTSNSSSFMRRIENVTQGERT